MKTNEQLLKDIEALGVFIYKNGEYICTGYDFDITVLFVSTHKRLIQLTDEK